MSRARWHEQWPPQRPRHVWVRPSGEPGAQPRQGLLLRWERDRPRGRWLALVVVVDGGELRLVVVAADRLAPVESDPNRVLSRDAAVVRGLRRPGR
ncbi:MULTISPECIES: hypothetical protein [Janibacter]|uniref:Uncharacterized protein n=1 Tax=Janibacter melonis TaxID=262209 RepID=A0A5P8FJP0_9MICO|nr:hypothetical protein [Janibacter melonis]MCB5992437.1 hypothetical protein [Janibacter melonis]QFQ29381.1 hypothetical protein EEW87_002120 [Janibacter melonis]